MANTYCHLFCMPDSIKLSVWTIIFIFKIILCARHITHRPVSRQKPCHYFIWDNLIGRFPNYILKNEKTKSERKQKVRTTPNKARRQMSLRLLNFKSLNKRLWGVKSEISKDRNTAWLMLVLLMKFSEIATALRYEIILYYDNSMSPSLGWKESLVWS